jgi:hypothetical protein
MPCIISLTNPGTFIYMTSAKKETRLNRVEITLKWPKFIVVVGSIYDFQKHSRFFSGSLKFLTEFAFDSPIPTHRDNHNTK